MAHAALVEVKRRHVNVSGSSSHLRGQSLRSAVQKTVKNATIKLFRRSASTKKIAVNTFVYFLRLE